MKSPHWARIDNPGNVQLPSSPYDDEPPGRPVPCSACGGTGTDSHKQTCVLCSGLGRIYEHDHGGES